MNSERCGKSTPPAMVYDIKSMFGEIRAREETSGREYVRYPPRRIDAVKEARAASPTCAGTSCATNTATTS